MDWSLVGTWALNLVPVIVAGAAFAGVIYYFFKNPDSKYLQYKGLVFQAVKMAEKAIDDNTENKSVAKADRALKIFCELYEANTGATPDAAMKAWFSRVKEEVLYLIESGKK